MKNFLIRAVTGLIFIAIVIGCTLYGAFPFMVLFAGFAALAIYEFGCLVNRTGIVHVNKLITALGGAYLFFAFAFFFLTGESYVFIFYSFLLMYLMISELYKKQEHPVHNWAYSMLSQLYIGLPFSMLNVLAFHAGGTEADSVSYNPILPLSVFIFIWLNDTGAYCVGTLMGKHRLFERISPKKSWEGSIGGGILALASAFVLAHYFPFMPVAQWVGLAFVAVLFGTWGDLAESLLKRTLGIKDSGSIFPGHGGFLDRFDSALMAIPAAVIYLYAVSLF